MFKTGIVRLVVIAALAAAVLAGADVPRSGNLGRVWEAREWRTARMFWRGKWTRAGNSNRFDVFYRDQAGKRYDWSLTVDSVRGQNVGLTFVVLGRKIPGTGVIQADGKTIKGRAGYCYNIPDCGFEVVADWPMERPALAAAPSRPGEKAAPQAPHASSGTVRLDGVWKVRDSTVPEYEWAGIWTLSGTEVKFRYSDRASGTKSEGGMRVMRWDGFELIIENRASRSYYRGQLQPDGRTLKGTTMPCVGRKTCVWEAVR